MSLRALNTLDKVVNDLKDEIATLKALSDRKERFIAELQEENDRKQHLIAMLQAKNDRKNHFIESMFVTIASPDGKEIYAEGLLAHRTVNDVENQHQFDQDLFLSSSTGRNANPNLAMCKVTDIEKAVIKVGHATIATIGDFIPGMQSTFNKDSGYVELVYKFHMDPASVGFEGLGRILHLFVVYGQFQEGTNKHPYADGKYYFPDEINNDDSIGLEVRFWLVSFSQFDILSGRE